ncbi:U3 small nucleolar RNA-associated protein 10 [Penicillium chermesinum]|uniref:U3 small nucleolar RNA-associated protein 10 n=1 Tax=Penicillium chermesinum TaxID=63820 RepID=A0A9W9TGC3_9EURO|nr:U3 small nucleolar RNA-associated protein 10 [Penicillium chermesinum]KAJ5220460.1 U3 small nucleolar RNA-associated protein 10 [Penicillium chermesinum]
MASSLTAQLSRIAAKSTHELDLKAQRISHSQSLIFDHKIAGSQDFDTVYDICSDGFRELCSLDGRFRKFELSIFSEQSKGQDRTQMNSAQNKELNITIENFLALVGGEVATKPGCESCGLVTANRSHEYNTTAMLLTFLPYHTTPLFLNLLSILPNDLSPAFKVLYPYKAALTNPPRHPIVHSATTNRAFFAELNEYVLRTSELRAHSHPLLSFWAGITTEAVAGMLENARSGRREVEKQKQDDICRQVLSVLSRAFVLKDVSELIISCYMISVVLAQKASLSNDYVNGLMECVVDSWTQETLSSGLICLSVLAQHKPSVALPERVFKAISRLDRLVPQISEVTAKYQPSKLLLGLVHGCLSDLSKQKSASRVLLARSILQSTLLGDDSLKEAIEMLLKAASNTDVMQEVSLETQTQITELIEELTRSSSIRPIFQAAIAESPQNISAVELHLQTLLEAPVQTGTIQDVEMEDVALEPATDRFSAALEAFSEKPLYSSSFLSKQHIPEFEDLVQILASAFDSDSKISQFTDLPILGKSKATQSPQYLSFFARVASGPYPTGPKIAALQAISSVISSVSRDFDPQALLPFLLVSLEDSSQRIRREAGGVLAAISSLCKKSKGDDGESKKPWAHNSIYGSGSPSAGISWLSSRDVSKFLERSLLPELEESILDPAHVSKVLDATLRGSVLSEDSGASELKKSLRLNLFTFLCSHVTHLPVFGPKIRLLRQLNGVKKVSGTTRAKELLPLLENWRGLSQTEVEDICSKEHIPISEAEQEIVAIITPKDADAIDALLSFVSSSESVRPSFVTADFNRMKQIWPKVAEDSQLVAADKLLEVSLGLTNEKAYLADSCRDVLRSVDLSGPILLNYVKKIPESLTQIDGLAPAPKRRRTSQNNMVAMTVRDEAEFSKIVDKMTFILEIVDSSTPESHPELADGLFQTLAALHHFKSQIQSGMSYLLSLTLGSLLAIVNKSKASAKPLFDTSVIRADLVVDCVRTTESPQVQNAALLLVAGISVIAPELVLHSVMPIFTFMGSSVLRKDDDYSVSVIDQTIDQVVPALIQSLRDQKRDVVSGTSELLLSFTAAFEHIPSHRRLRLFHALITKLGTQDFLFAVLAMLANRYATNKDVLTLMSGVVSDTDPVVELTTYSKYLNLVIDALKPKPGISQVLLGIGSDDGRDPQKVSVDLLRDLAHLLKHSTLKSKLEVAFSKDDDFSNQARACFSRVLEQVLSIGESVKTMAQVSHACGEVLGSLFSTLSFVDFLDTVEVLLDGPDNDLRCKLLRLLENRLRQSPERDSESQIRVLDFLPTLVKIVESPSFLPLLKHAAVACIDRVTEKYGRKDPSKVITAAKVVASPSCLGVDDDRIRNMGVLCLASMAEVLGEAMIPALPDTLSQSFRLLELSLAPGKENARLHNAVFSLLSALLANLPFMISSSHLDNILLLSFKSTEAGLEESCDEAPIERNWLAAVSSGAEATNEVLQTLSLAVEKNPKSVIVKNIDILSRILFNAYDLRRQAGGLADVKFSADPSELDEAETLLNDVTIKMIYKLNDSTFRPLFVKFVDWATTAAPKDKDSQIARLTTFYKFLQVFFGTLQSIVTSYSNYILENVVQVLATVGPALNTRPLWLASLRTLRNSFEHDQDEFWQSPSHLASITGPLVAQLAHATTAKTAEIVAAEVIPAIVELAVAADSTDNYKEINNVLMKYLRPSFGPNAQSTGGANPFTRLVAVKTERALTEQLGEEWLALLPEMLPYINELQEDEDEGVEREVRKWGKHIENIIGEKIDDMMN